MARSTASLSPTSAAQTFTAYLVCGLYTYHHMCNICSFSMASSAASLSLTSATQAFLAFVICGLCIYHICVGFANCPWQDQLHLRHWPQQFTHFWHPWCFNTMWGMYVTNNNSSYSAFQHRLAVCVRWQSLPSRHFCSERQSNNVYNVQSLGARQQMWHMHVTTMHKICLCPVCSHYFESRACKKSNSIHICGVLTTDALISSVDMVICVLLSRYSRKGRYKRFKNDWGIQIWH